MKIYTYKGISRIKIILSQGIGIVGIVLFSLLAGFLLINITKIQPYNSAESFINNPRVTLICFAIWFLVISWLIGFTFINYFPTIWVTDNGILISSFIFFRIFIPREEIKGEISGILLSESILIMVNKINPFYYIYGLLYAHKLGRGFLIGKDIENRDTLIHEIRQMINK